MLNFASETIKNRRIRIMERMVFMVRVDICGLYEWGRGWVSSEKARLWNEFWAKCDSVHWSVSKDKLGYGCDLLVSMSGCIYLHPMDFNTVLVSTWTSGDDPYVKELHKIVDECANYVGFTYEFKVSRKQNIVFTDFYEMKKQ